MRPIMLAKTNRRLAVENILSRTVCASAAPLAIHKPELLQEFRTLDGVWVVQDVVIDLMEPDFFMVQLTRLEDFSNQWAEAQDVYSGDWAQWLADNGAYCSCPLKISTRLA